MKPKDTIAKFDTFLAERNLSLEAIVVGGSALGLLGIVSCHTRDCDILHPELPQIICDAARDFAELQSHAGEILSPELLNNGPSSLCDILPSGWQDRLQIAFEGRVLKLLCLGRFDLLITKLFALCNRGIVLGDCLALKPSFEELTAAIPWLEEQDGNPGWPCHAKETLDDLRRRLG